MSDGDGFDPSEVAARAVGDTTSSTTSADGSNSEGVAPDHADAEGAPDEDTIGNSSWWRESLMSTDPSPRLEDVEAPYDPDLGGPARIYRGIQKAFGVDGMPAIVDLVMGSIETVKQFEPAGGEDGDDGDAGGVEASQQPSPDQGGGSQLV